MTLKLKRLRLLLVPIVILLCMVVIGGGKASAANFNFADHLMDDVVMRASSSMTANDIQTFLTQKGSGLAVFSDVENCGSTSGAHYAYYATYYACGQSRSAAQIIFDAGRAYGINPQVLIATLQKEQSLITTPNPTASQINFAMGYGCPDSGSCSFPGFFNQLDNSAWQFRTYMELGSGNNWWGYTPTNYPCNGATRFYNAALKPGNDVTFIDGNGTGYTHFVIPNIATGGLYCYTPHAYNNPQGLFGLPQYGSVGSYYSGSYNFVYYFNRWFDINSLILNSVSVTTNAPPYSTPARGQAVTYTVTFTNNLTEDITASSIFIAGRAGSVTGGNRDFGWQGPITLKAGIPQQLTFTTTVQDTGPTYMWPTIFYQGNFVQYNNWGSTVVGHAANLTLSQPLIMSPTSVYAGQDVTFSATLKNNEPYPINYDAIGIPVKFYNRYSYDAVWVGPGTIAAGAELPLTGLRNIDKPGPFTYWVSDYLGGNYTTIGSVKSFNSMEVSPNFTVAGISLTNNPPVVGQNLGASISVTNNLPVGIDVDAVGIVGRLGTFNGPNRDIGWQGPIHFNAGETKSLAGFSRNITDLGTHYYWIGILYKGNYFQYNNWGSTVVSLAPSFSVSGLSFTNNPPAVGQSLGASFSVKNNLSVPIDVDAVGVVGRYGSFAGANRDIGWQGPIHFNAGETKPFTGYSRTITDLGTHYYWIGVLYNGGYLQYNNWGSTVVSH